MTARHVTVKLAYADAVRTADTLRTFAATARDEASRQEDAGNPSAALMNVVRAANAERIACSFDSADDCIHGEADAPNYADKAAVVNYTDRPGLYTVNSQFLLKPREGVFIHSIDRAPLVNIDYAAFAVLRDDHVLKKTAYALAARWVHGRSFPVSGVSYGDTAKVVAHIHAELDALARGEK